MYRIELGLFLTTVVHSSNDSFVLTFLRNRSLHQSLTTFRSRSAFSPSLHHKEINEGPSSNSTISPASFSRKKSVLPNTSYLHALPLLCQPNTLGSRIDVLGRNVLAVVVLKDSGEVTLAIARAWMLLFTKLRVSIQSPRPNMGEQVTHAKMAIVAPAGISAFSIALLKSSCTLLAR
jgi:hypothetical protein